MKEKIVIGRNEDTSEIVKKFPNRSGEHIDFIEIFTPRENCKFEQVPETLGQVAFLLRQKLQENNRDWYIETHIDRCKQEFRFMGILFSSNKTLSIKVNGADVVVMINISYPLMWQIIKNLIGEE